VPARRSAPTRLPLARHPLGWDGGTAGWPIVSDNSTMVGLIIFLLILWVVLAVVGFVVHAALWLAIIAIVLFIATSVFGWIRRKAR
jgi:CDP-diglyceride synthetase